MSSVSPSRFAVAATSRSTAKYSSERKFWLWMFFAGSSIAMGYVGNSSTPPTLARAISSSSRRHSATVQAGPKTYQCIRSRYSLGTFLKSRSARSLAASASPRIASAADVARNPLRVGIAERAVYQWRVILFFKTASPAKVDAPGGFVVIDKSLLPLRLRLSVTSAVKLLAAATVGVPEIIPVEPASVSPAGSAPPVIDHVNGAVPPVLVSVCE